MKAYFSQFGDVSRLRLARNKKVSRRCIPDEILPLFTEINLNPQSSLPSYVSDRSIETFRLYRDAQQVGRRDHGRDDAQLPAHGSYPAMSREFALWRLEMWLGPLTLDPSTLPRDDDRRSCPLTRSTRISGSEPTGNGDESRRLDWRGLSSARYGATR